MYEWNNYFTNDVDGMNVLSLWARGVYMYASVKDL